MQDYTIRDFWQKRLPVKSVNGAPLVKGWFVLSEGLGTFKEAPLSLSEELNRGAPQTSSILLVSAPGAVGKSTLARQIAFATGAVYINLAQADPVGGNTISGALLRSGLSTAWAAEATTILIDGLDEARMRVTQEAFEAFLDDVAALAKGRKIPLVLFGRSGAIADAWALLDESPGVTAVLEIGYYGAAAAVDFAMALVEQDDKSGKSSFVVERQAVELLLERLRSQTETDGDKFAGYAPVLQAVAKRVVRDNNLGALVAQIKAGTQPVTLQEVGASILDRERSKLEPLFFDDTRIKEKLYLPEEQLDRLVATVYGLVQPELPLPSMSPKDAQTYSNALKSWVAEHPFLDGARKASSAVFEAMLTIRALKRTGAAEPALHRELSRGASANPFLAEFYLPAQNTLELFHLPPEHVGIVYSSLRARLSLGDSASLLIDAPEDAVEEEALQAVVEITLARRNEFERPRTLRFQTEQVGVLYLGAYVEDVELNLPQMKVDVGPGPSAVFVAPISVQCQQLVLRAAEKVIVEPPPGLNGEAVYLEAQAFDGDQMMSVPIVRGDVSLKVSWPGANAFPWSAYATEPTPVDDPRLDEGLRRFRKFLTAFRSHSRGNLARLQDKIESERMTKGAGQAVLDRLIEDRVLTLRGRQYILDPDRLGAQTDAAYVDVMARRFAPKTIEYVKKALDTHGP